MDLGARLNLILEKLDKIEVKLEKRWAEKWVEEVKPSGTSRRKDPKSVDRDSK